jgi:hypothetical protein
MDHIGVDIDLLIAVIGLRTVVIGLLVVATVLLTITMVLQTVIFGLITVFMGLAEIDKTVTMFILLGTSEAFRLHIPTAHGMSEVSPRSVTPILLPTIGDTSNTVLMIDTTLQSVTIIDLFFLVRLHKLLS